MTKRQSLIQRFNEKHSLGEDQQFKQLTEEIGELSEALNRHADDEEVIEELADVIFVARSLAAMRDGDIDRQLGRTIDENLAKDATTDGDKVTKDVSPLQVDYGISVAEDGDDAEPSTGVDHPTVDVEGESDEE